MLNKLRFWCNKIIPLVYDEALSYYEVLCKVAHKINELVESNNELYATTVFKVNDVEPVDGNVTLTPSDFEGFVGSVNGVTPVDGNVTITGADISGVIRTVNGFSPNSSGDVNTGTVRSVNGKSPTSLPTPGSITLNASDVGALPNSIDPVETVNGISPDSNGNVNVGTVKSVNNTQPDSSGNVNLPTVQGVTSVDNIGADGEGNIRLGLNEVVEVYVNGSTGSDSNDGSSEHPFATIGKAITNGKKYHYDGVNGIYIINIAGGTYNEFLDIRRYPVRISLDFNGDATIGGVVFRSVDALLNIGNHTLTMQRDTSLSYWGGATFGVQGDTILAVGGTGTIAIVDNTNEAHINFSVNCTYPLYLPSLTFSGTNISNLNSVCMQIINGSNVITKTLTAPVTNLGKVAEGSRLFCDWLVGHDYSGTNLEHGGRITESPYNGNVTWNTTNTDTSYSSKSDNFFVDNNVCYVNLRAKAKINFGNSDVELCTGLPKRNANNPSYLYAFTTASPSKINRVHVTTDGKITTFYAGVGFDADETFCITGCYPIL